MDKKAGAKLWAHCNRSMHTIGDYHPIDLIQLALEKAQDEGWNEALDAAVKITDDHECAPDPGAECFCALVVGHEINDLKHPQGGKE